jgi:hypothetical protein
MAELDDLFNGGLDEKMDFLKEKKQTNNDGIYRIDPSKAKDKKKGYRSVVRFLPNITQEGKLGQSAIEKIAHYVRIPNPKELSGWFDSPKNFGEKCPLTDLYYTLQNSKNVILVEKSKALNYSRKYYSYVLIIEDEQQPELVGKIMIMQYGKIIRDKILAEKNGDISGEPVNIFSATEGKDFVLVVKEIDTGEITYPDYKNSMFRPQVTSLPIYSEKTGEFKNVPLTDDGKVQPKVQEKVKSFLLDREFELEDFAPKPLTEEQHAKITEISNFLTGKASASYQASNDAGITSDDFLEDTESTTKTTATATSSADEDEDDFFDDL